MDKQIGKLFVISAPSGAGKTTLVERALNELGCLKRVVTFTTKEPRARETQDIDYYFISRAEFEQKIAEHFFLEWSDVYGAYYGTPRSILQELEQGESRIVIVDRKGALAIQEIYPEAVLIWIKPPSLEILKQRLCDRNTESAEKINFRLALAQNELAVSPKEFNYVLVNNDLNQATHDLISIIKKQMGKI
jgi:guanylate kinase